ncbi:phage tail protein [Rhizobium lentis]|uniref:portal protein n=1 Tax=Rhizobium lentis TaxID=1138194 RepID=UPI001C83309B|nr:portal protein [Rhizobium lentis]MBX5001880.1 phage tail protein [Rhizobium lentis]
MSEKSDADKGYPSQDVTKEALRRLAAARQQKSWSKLDLQEAYFFTRPQLSYLVESLGKPVRKRDDQQDELATGIGPEVSEDLATEGAAAFFPQGTNWVTSEIAKVDVVDLDAAAIADLEKDAKERDEIIFSAIRSSNFEAELGTTLDPHLAVGTVAWWIDKPTNTKPINVQTVPPRELEINVEADGSVGDRFRVRHVPGPQVASVIPEIKLPEKTQTKIKSERNCYIEIVWCFWRDWSDPEKETWTHVLLVDKTAVHQQSFEGEGCVPLIVARMSPAPDFAWGFGPSIKALPEYRVLDVITAATQDRVDIAISPPIGYPDDGVTDFEGGLEAGKAYPMRPGSGRDVTSLYFGGDPDIGFYTASDLERRIKRKHFADYPEQKGDTPPTATQWADEMVKAQRRIGTPGKKFWREGPYMVYRRFEWLLQKDGAIEDVAIDGKKLTLIANNPATQAADNQKVQVAGNLLTMSKSFFPETSAAAIDERATIDNLKKLMNDEVVVLRNETQTSDLLNTVLGAAQSAGVVPGQGGQ